MSESRERPGCFRCGCFGCLGLVALSILVFVVLGFVQFRRESREPVIEDARVERPLPTSEEFAQLRRLGELSTETLSFGAQLGDQESSARVGRVRLDLDLGEFEIRAGQPGEGVRVEGTYEPDAYRLEEDFEQDEDGGWTYSVDFGPRGGMAGVLLRGAGSQPQNRLVITLPPDVPFDLEGEWGIGEVRADLGGLWLRSVDLDMATGAHELEFSSPTLWPIAEFAVEKGPGELVIDRLGNASPERVEVDQSIGSVRVDLGGNWVGNSFVNVSTSIGEVDVDAPDGVFFELVGADASLGESYVDPEVRQLTAPEGAPTVRLEANLSLGSIRIDGPRRPREAPAESTESPEDVSGPM